jgi:flagellar basal body-associated protein FliL
MAQKTYSRAKHSAPNRKPLPLILAGGIALALVAIGAFFLLSSGEDQPPKPVEVAGQPNLTVDRQQIDFGMVPVEQVVKAEFELSNTGDQALQIVGAPQVEVREGC